MTEDALHPATDATELHRRQRRYDQWKLRLLVALVAAVLALIGLQLWALTYLVADAEARAQRGRLVAEAVAELQTYIDTGATPSRANLQLTVTNSRNIERICRELALDCEPLPEPTVAPSTATPAPSTTATPEAP